ncbi:MAG: hypothetical protein ACPLYF_02250 [Fervidobacterium sp.]
MEKLEILNGLAMVSLIGIQTFKCTHLQTGATIEKEVAGIEVVSVIVIAVSL